MKNPLLFTLVKSLDKAERRFLSLYGNLGTGRGADQYLRLLEIFEKEETYDRSRILKAFGGDEKTLAVNQSRLFDYILKSLRLQKSGKSLDSRLRVLLEDVEILYQRGQVEAALKRLRKAKKLGRQYERDIVLLELYGWERRLNPNPSLELRTQIDREEELCHDRVALYGKLKRYHEEMRWRIRRENRAHSDKRQSLLMEILERPELKVEVPLSHFLAFVYQQNTIALYYTSTAQWTKAIPIYSNLVEQFLERPELISYQAELFLGVQNNYLQACIFGVENREEFANAARQMNQIAGLSPTDQIKFQRISYMQRLLLDMNVGQLKDAVALVGEIAEWMEKNEKRLVIRRRLVFYYNFTILFFIRGDFSTSNQWLQRILDCPGKDERLDIRIFARLFRVILHFELGNTDLYEYLLRSVHRHLKKSQRMQDFEMALLHFTRRVAQSLPGSLNPFQELLPELENIMERKGDRPPLGAQELVLWAKGKIEGNGTEAQYLLARAEK